MHIALITCDPAALPSDVAAFMVRTDLPLAEALEARGAEVSRPVWSDAGVDWADFDLALVRTTWDYTERRPAFVEWAAHTGLKTRLWNPPDVLRWNSHKSYLLELEDRGAPVVPTAWLGQGDRVELGALLTARGWRRAVVKPAVASGSRGMVRVSLDAVGPSSERAASGAASGADPIDPSRSAGAGELDLASAQRHLDAVLAVGDALVQPYLPAVTRRGELSVVVVDGEVSHAVRKVPPSGEFRVQESYGGRYRAEAIDTDVATLARWVVDATGTDLLIARVDLLEDETGAHQVVEVEATEPDLYLAAHPGAAGHIADAILRRARA